MSSALHLTVSYIYIDVCYLHTIFLLPLFLLTCSEMLSVCVGFLVNLNVLIKTNADALIHISLDCAAYSSFIQLGITEKNQHK